MKDLKNHMFFADFEFDKFKEMKSPIEIMKMIDNDLVEEEISSEEEMIGKHKREKTIILSGLVKKMKYVLMYNTRQLILYSNGVLEYFDPKQSLLKG